MKGNRFLEDGVGLLVDGRPALSPRQYEVWCLLQHSNKQIARILGISEGSVKVHLGLLFRKSRMSRRELIAERGPSTPVFPYLSPPPNKIALAA